MFSYILFDLDGTISDPKAGICGSVQYALKSFGIEEPDMGKLEPFIGPPLRDSFMQYYGFGAEQAQEAVEKYREHFSVTGKYENTLYPGMAELLRDLQAAGAHLAIASSKPAVFAEDILRYFGIRQHFEIVVGSGLDGTREKKEEVIAEAIRLFAKRGAAEPSGVVMIGDRKFDIEGAKAVGAHNIGVSYGYSAPGELEEAGAEIIVRDVEGLRRVLLGNLQPGGPVLQPLQQLQPPPYFGSQHQNQQTYQTGYQVPQTNGGGYPVQQFDQNGYPAPPPYQNGYPAQQPYPNGYPVPPFRNGVPDYAAGQRQGVYSGYGRRYRIPRPESKGKRIAKAIGFSLLAMAIYYVAVSVLATIVIFAGMLLFDAGSNDDSYFFWINLANAVGIIGGFAACFGIWHKGIRIRSAKPVSVLSLAPLGILAASLAMGLNGLLNLIKLYEYSPSFQEVSELQGDIPVWLGILSYGILAPLGEETVFRGVVYGQLKKIGNVPLAVIVSGLAFGLFHGNLVQAVYATAIGIVLAVIYEVYGSILYPMLFHGIANLFVYLIIDLTDFGGIFMIPVSCLFFLLMSAVSLVLMVKWQKAAL